MCVCLNRCEGSSFPGRYQEISITTSFQNLGLTAELLRAVAEQGYTIPTPIQAQAIPVVLAGRDLLGAAQTGTGKTAGFTLPMLQRLTKHDLHRHAGTQAPSNAPGHHPGGQAQARHSAPGSGSPSRAPRALVLVPTRELAAQVQESVLTYGKHLRLRSTAIFGGVGIHPQITELRRGVDIVVATPGRLLDHVQQKTIDLRQIEILVLDEADRMLDMGFIHDIRRILGLLPPVRQNLLFSATFPDEIRRLAATFMRDPATVEVAPRNTPVELIAQVVHPVDKDRKRALLSHLVNTQNWQQVLVFTKTKHGANRLAEQLGQDGIDADAIHGNKSQPQRTRALKRFKDNELQVLVATDIAARGIDIDALPHVVNYDLPNVSEDYVHRIGRTGRAGSQGEAVSLVSGEDRSLLSDIERLIGRKIEQRIVASFEPGPGYHSAKPEPRPQRSQQRRSSEPQRPRSAPSRNPQRAGEARRGGSTGRAPRTGAEATPGRRTGPQLRPGRPGQGNTQRNSQARRPDEAERTAQAQYHAQAQRAGTSGSRDSHAGAAATRRSPVTALLGFFSRKTG